MGAPAPIFIPQPFAKNATGGTRNVIPDTTITPALASYDKGFPSITMQPVIAGGKPPFGQDFNGILYALSSHTFYLQAGQPYLFNTSVRDAISGYAKGTLLGMADGTGVWMSAVDNNMTDPDGVGAAGWVPSFSYGIQTITTTGGTATLTAAQTRRGIIVVNGALGSNVILIFPTSIQRWLIVNNTSGAFTLTVKTAAGAGVTINAGGFSNPVEVYGDGTNLYTAVSPVVLATDVAPTPNTIALRNAFGYLFAVYLNQSSAVENFAISSIMAQTGTDGYLRKISIANFASQIALSQFAGQVTAGQVPLSAVIQYETSFHLANLLGQVTNAQVPQSAVTQYTPQILASAALTGTPTAPTPPPGDSSTRVATTEFVNPGLISLGLPGYCQFSNGLVLQWGFNASGGVSFPIPFPNYALIGLCGTYPRSGLGSAGSNFTYSLTQFGMGVVFDPTPGTGFWIALGA